MIIILISILLCQTVIGVDQPNSANAGTGFIDDLSKFINSDKVKEISQNNGTGMEAMVETPNFLKEDEVVHAQNLTIADQKGEGKEIEKDHKSLDRTQEMLQDLSQESTLHDEGGVGEATNEIQTEHNFITFESASINKKGMGKEIEKDHKSLDQTQETSQELSQESTLHYDMGEVGEVTNGIQTENNIIIPESASINAAELSFSACEKLDMAVEFMTSLNFQEHYQKLFALTNPYNTEILGTDSDFYVYVYILQLIFTPIFLALLLFGANLFLHTFVICAAVIGLFAMFDGVEGLLPVQLDCPMKLALSVIASFLCAVMATTFFRVGLFALGSLASGGAAYVLFDAFPQIDPGLIIFTPNNATGTTGINVHHLMPTSDLSTIAWVITLFISAAGGILIRYFEMAMLEITTAGMGGVGCAYSIHTFFIIQGRPLDPSVIFLLAFFVSIVGWKFQRHRRQTGVLQQQYLTSGTAIPWHTIEQQHKLEESMTSLLKLHHDQQQQQDGPSSDQISELTLSINKFMNAMEEGQKRHKEKSKEEKNV